jgi:hypothetical protein
MRRTKGNGALAARPSNERPYVIAAGGNLDLALGELELAEEGQFVLGQQVSQPDDIGREGMIDRTPVLRLVSSGS